MSGGKFWVRAAVLVAFGALVAGCTSAAPAPELTPSEATSQSGIAVPSAPPSLSDAELYALAVSQYEKLFAIITDIDRQGGAATLPEEINAYLMDPAYKAYNDLYVGVLLSGDRYVGIPQYSITDISMLDGEELAPDTAIALQTCELFQGASTVDKTGNTVRDAQPVLRHIKAYLKFDSADAQLKVFVLNGEEVAECPL